jgi:hypothetical protein
MAKGVLGGIAAAGLMNMLTGPGYYSSGLFGAPVMGGFFGGGPMFGGYGFGEGYEEGLEEGFEGDFGGRLLEQLGEERMRQFKGLLKDVSSVLEEDRGQR